jgi:cytochrome oxidase Cu insertion factor (SCO1/SenC/PrrC family)
MLLFLAILVVCAAAGVVVASQGKSPAPRALSEEFRGPVMPPNFRAPDFSLRDQGGSRVSLSSYRGRVVILSFMHAGCHSTCPIMTQQIRGALDDLGASVPVLAVSVNPEEDTPALARQFIAKQRMTGRMRFLVGKLGQLKPVWKGYGIQPDINGLHHSAFVFLVDQRGYARVGFPAAHLTPEALEHDLRQLGVARRA